MQKRGDVDHIEWLLDKSCYIVSAVHSFTLACIDVCTGEYSSFYSPTVGGNALCRESRCVKELTSWSAAGTFFMGSQCILEIPEVVIEEYRGDYHYHQGYF